MADEADRLVREGEHGEAEVLYKKLLSNNPEPILRRRILTKLTDLYLSLRKRNEAIPLLQQIARDYPHIAILFVTGYVGEAGQSEDFAGHEVLHGADFDDLWHVNGSPSQKIGFTF